MSQNYELISNIAPKHRVKNYSNDFEVPLTKLIDSSIVEKQIEITEVTFPNTSKNILKDECSIQLEITFNEVQKFSDEVKNWFTTDLTNAEKDNGYKMFNRTPGKVNVTFDKYTLPSGSYDVGMILKILNRSVNPYSITFEQEENKRIKIRFGSVANYYVEFKTNFIGDPSQRMPPTHFAYGDRGLTHTIGIHYGIPQSGKSPMLTLDGGTLNEYRKSNIPTSMNYKITFSKKLAFILGFEKTIIEKAVNVTSNERHSKEGNYIVGDFLPAQNGGEDRLYFYCDQIVGTNVGNNEIKLLVSVPRYENEFGKGGVETYNPPKTVHKLKKMKIDKFDIKVKNGSGELVNFDSGTVNVKAIIS